MIVFLRNEMQAAEKDTVCCAIKTRHVEVFHGGEGYERIELCYPEDVTYINIEHSCYRWGELYEFFIMYDDADEYIIRDAFPLCKWFVGDDDEPTV